MAIDFKRMFKDLNVPIRDERRDGTWIQVNCPFCVTPKDTHFNGGFNQIRPTFSCWRCGTHNYLDALSRIMNVDTKHVIQTIKGYRFISENKGEKKIAQGHDLKLPGYRTLNDAERKYLENRGFNIEYLRSKFHIRGGGICGDWSYRILIPIYYNGELVSWVGRSILDKKQLEELKIPRYKNLSIEQSVINSKEIFFNLNNCHRDSVILVEGSFDVMRLGDDTICSLGTSVTPEQQLFLASKFKKVFIAFDNEPGAQAKAKHLGMNLSSVGMKVEVVNAYEDFGKNDAGELTESEAIQVKKELGMY